MSQTHAENWHERVKPIKRDYYNPKQNDHDIWQIENGVRNFEVPKDADGKYPPKGTWLCARRARRKLRTRYVVMEVTSDWGGATPTNTEIVYRKSKRTWVIQIDGVPVNEGYHTIKAAKTAFLKHPLDRLAAESQAAI